MRFFTILALTALTAVEVNGYSKTFYDDVFKVLEKEGERKWNSAKKPAQSKMDVQAVLDSEQGWELKKPEIEGTNGRKGGATNRNTARTREEIERGDPPSTDPNRRARWPFEKDGLLNTWSWNLEREDAQAHYRVLLALNDGILLYSDIFNGQGRSEPVSAKEKSAKEEVSAVKRAPPAGKAASPALVDNKCQALIKKLKAGKKGQAGGPARDSSDISSGDAGWYMFKRTCEAKLGTGEEMGKVAPLNRIHHQGIESDCGRDLLNSIWSEYTKDKYVKRAQGSSTALACTRTSTTSGTLSSTRTRTRTTETSASETILNTTTRTGSLSSTSTRTKTTETSIEKTTLDTTTRSGKTTFSTSIDSTTSTRSSTSSSKSVPTKTATSSRKVETKPTSTPKPSPKPSPKPEPKPDPKPSPKPKPCRGRKCKRDHEVVERADNPRTRPGSPPPADADACGADDYVNGDGKSSAIRRGRTKHDDKKALSFKPNEPEFLAIMGLDNGASVRDILKFYGKETGKTTVKSVNIQAEGGAWHIWWNLE